MAEFTKKYECGCSIETGRSGNPFIVYCPKHKAAPAMYEALKAILTEPNLGLLGRLYVPANKALAQADGRTP